MEHALGIPTLPFQTTKSSTDYRLTLKPNVMKLYAVGTCAVSRKRGKTSSFYVCLKTLVEEVVDLCSGNRAETYTNIMIKMVVIVAVAIIAFIITNASVIIIIITTIITTVFYHYHYYHQHHLHLHHFHCRYKYYDHWYYYLYNLSYHYYL